MGGVYAKKVQKLKLGCEKLFFFFLFVAVSQTPGI